jgi:signal transduction histidine kinase
MALGLCLLHKSSKIWLAGVWTALGGFTLCAIFLPHSFRLAALTDIIQALLLLSGLLSFLPLALHSRGRIRLFWSLLMAGVQLWFFYQLLWTCYEVVLRRTIPDIFAGDIVLFLNIVPMMAAIALRPHVTRDEYAARVGGLDFALLLVWWLYLYVLVVIPWQYVVPNVAAYEQNLNNAYSAEKLAFLVGLSVCWIASRGGWRRLYLNLFGMSLTYSAGSVLANWAIARHAYYSGSLYDIPLTYSMAWLTWIGLRSRTEDPQTDAGEVSPTYGVWVARCSMIAAFSLPLFAAWAMSDYAIPARIRVFRLLVTLIAAVVMGVLVFRRQYRLERELVHRLHNSHESFENLKRLQAQILQSEKLASIGQLVGGAAHELNNPITAMLGYSDLLLNTELTPRQKPLAATIGRDVRRTRSLVASLISFARQGSTQKSPLDLNTLVRTAVKLAQPQLESVNIRVQTEFDKDLPKVLGDANQLLQVCLQLLGNCSHAIGENGKTLLVRTQRESDMCTLSIATAPEAVDSAGSADLTDQVQGLSACQGIVQEHGGSIFGWRTQEGAVSLRVELPAFFAALSRERQAISAAVWPAPPFA